MKTRLTLISAIALLAGCGGEMDDFLDAGTEPQYYAFNAGTYALTNAVAVGPDQCGLVGAYQDPSKKIGIDLTGTTLNFNLSNNPSASANSIPTATHNGDNIEALSEANYTVKVDDTCVVRMKSKISGHVVADNTAALTLDFSVATEAGTCNAELVGVDAFPCASQYQFTATLAQ